MPNFLNDTIIVIELASAVILLFAIAYVAMFISGNRRIIEEQQKKIDEIRKSEQRYKALFENSLAGMMKFDYETWIVADANQALLDLFTVNSTYELQRTLTEFPADKIHQIGTSLRKSGIIDGLELILTVPSGITRRFLFSARREESDHYAHAVVVLMTAEKRIG